MSEGYILDHTYQFFSYLIFQWHTIAAAKLQWVANALVGGLSHVRTCKFKSVHRAILQTVSNPRNHRPWTPRSKRERLRLYWLKISRAGAGIYFFCLLVRCRRFIFGSWLSVLSWAVRATWQADLDSLPGRCRICKVDIKHRRVNAMRRCCWECKWEGAHAETNSVSYICHPIQSFQK